MGLTKPKGPHRGGYIQDALAKPTYRAALSGWVGLKGVRGREAEMCRLNMQVEGGTN